MIVVTAPTGHIGSRVLSELLKLDEPIRVVVRDAARLPDDVTSRVEIVEGSHRDKAVVDRAFVGADAVFWLMPADPTATSIYQTYVGDSIAAADAVVANRVPRIVVVSALGRGTQLYGGHVSASLAMEDLFRSTGAHVRALACSSFMDNVTRQVAAIADRGVLTGNMPAEQKLPTVATRDIADVAVRLLADRTWTGQDTVDVPGPDDLAGDDRAAILSDVLGTPIRYERGDRASDKATYVGYGISDAVAQALVDMDAAKENGLDGLATRTSDVPTPTTFRQWATEVLAPALTKASTR